MNYVDRLKLGFLASHNGSNVEYILKNIREGYVEAEPKVIISNNFDAGVLQIAKDYGVPSFCLNSKNHSPYESIDDAILTTLLGNEVNLVLLAGYRRRVSNKVIDAFKNKLLNIHPALLPKYGGRGMYGENVHRAVISSQDTETGATIHIVNSEYDRGEILAQVKVPRYKNDTIETLSQRVLKFEHELYSQVLRDINKGIINLDDYKLCP